MSIIVVSGFPRSGTSMMMQMLQAGGIEILTDTIRKADEDNPKGYYEFERVKEIAKDKSWLQDTKGKAVKMVSELLRYLPRNYNYNVIFMQRKIEEILASQRKMLMRIGNLDDVTDEKMAELVRKHLREVKIWLDNQPNMKVLYVSYNKVLLSPMEQSSRINQFLGGSLNVEKMIDVIDPTLYRQRRNS